MTLAEREAISPKSRAGAFKPNLMKGEEPHEAALTNRTVESYGAQDLVSLRGAESSLPVPQVHSVLNSSGVSKIGI